MLQPGGRFAVSDVIADADMDEATRADMAAVDRLHRRRADRGGVRARARGRRPRGRRDPRDAPRARARGVGDHPRAQAAHARLTRDPAQRPADALPPLGGRPVEPVRRRPRRRDREQWRRSTTAERDLVYFVLSSLMVAEERITTKFSGLVGAHGTEEEATFLATQQVDEARHMQFYARFQDEVVAEPAAIARARRARARAGLRRVPPHLRRGARRGARAARRRARATWPRRSASSRSTTWSSRARSA